MKVTSIEEAWATANEIFPTDYVLDDKRTKNAGYNIYHSTAAGVNAWISDLGSRLEVNLDNGKTINIFVEEKEPDIEITMSRRDACDLLVALGYARRIKKENSDRWHELHDLIADQIVAADTKH